MTGINFSVMFSNPVSYKAGIEAGFLVFPHSDAVPDGWGMPFFAPDGTPIVPGTEGGPDANRLVGWDAKKEAWRVRRSKFFQCAGAIDWKGPWKNDKKKNKRYVVSVNGPSQRYWNAGGAFVYEGNNRNNEIYMDGRIIGVAPLPVLGAALSQIVVNDQIQKFLVAICKDGEQDVAYAKPFTGYVTRDKMTDEVRSAMMSLGGNTNPLGWVNVGGFACGDSAVPPEAPWFFNETGTEARTMRRAMVEWDNEAGEHITEMTFIECMFSYQPAGQAGDFMQLEQYEQNDFTWSEKVTRTNVTWTDPIGGVQYGGNPRLWHEDHLQDTEYMIGKTKVAVDWDLDLKHWVWGWITSNCNKQEWQFWTEGIDGANNGRHDGIPYPPDLPPAPGDHTESVWIGDASVVKFVIGEKANAPVLEMIVGWGRTGTKTLMLTGIEDSEDPYLYFWDSLDVHLHFVDLRDYVMAGFIRYDQLMLNDDETVAWTWEKVEYGGHQITQPYAEGKMFMRWQSDAVVFNSFLEMMGWSRHDMKLWLTTDYDVENKVTTYDMRWSNANLNEDLWKPDFRTFYLGDDPWNSVDVENTYFRRWGPSGLLYHKDRCQREGIYGSTEKGQNLVCYRYFDVNNTAMATAQLLEPEGDLATIVGGGDQFTPGGIV